MPIIKVDPEPHTTHREPWNERNMNPVVNPLVISQVTAEEFAKVVFFVEVTKADLEDALAIIAQGVSRSTTLIMKRAVFAMKAPHLQDLLHIPFDDLKAARSLEELEHILLSTGIVKLGE